MNRLSAQQQKQQEQKQQTGQAQTQQPPQAAAGTVAVRLRRVALLPFCVQGHIALNGIRVKIPGILQINIRIPVLQMIALANRIFGARKHFAVEYVRVLDGRPAVGFKVNDAVGGNNQRQVVRVGFVHLSAVPQ